MEFKVGDVVMLRSGGPRMTVERLPSDLDTVLLCSWFTGVCDVWGEVRHASFPADALNMVT